MSTSATLAGPGPGGRLGAWRSSWIEIVLLVIGAGLLAFLIRRIGVAPIAEALTRLGPALPLIIGVEALAVLANTLSWRCTIAPDRRGDVPFTRLMAARIVGDAVSYVIPGGAGEIPKVRQLARYVPMQQALASVAVAKLTEGIALGLFGIAGLVVAWPILVASSVSGLSIVIAAVAALGLAAGCLLAVRFELWATIVRIFNRLAVTHRERSRLVAAISMSTATAPLQQGLIGSTVWHLVGWLVNVVELWLACYFLGLRPPLGVVFAGEALGVLFDGIFFFVPMRIGAAEGGRVFVFGLLGFGTGIGLTLGLVRRIRELAWTVAGLAIYPWLARGDRPVPGRGTGQDRHGRVVTA